MSNNVLAVVIGTAIGMLCIVFMQMGIYHFYPLPAGTDLYDAASVNKVLPLMPSIIFVWLILSYVIASFLAGIMATLLSKRSNKNPALVCGIIMTLSGIIDIAIIHHPLWFSIADCCAYLPFSYIGYLAARKRAKPVI
ncbi:MAG: hypothetical protein BGO69_06165 [Bacteroidetes bacterium 46-16]|nr:MAG: hypothetical protein BGO69_06165 [Bacteroidetes bacterium 46-16]